MFQDSIFSPCYIPEQKEPCIFHVFCILEKVIFTNIHILGLQKIYPKGLFKDMCLDLAG